MAAVNLESIALEQGRLEGIAELRRTIMDALNKADANGRTRIVTRDARLLVTASANVARDHQQEDSEFLAMVTRTLVGREKKAG